MKSLVIHCIAVLSLAALRLSADATYDVAVDTSPLTGHVAGPFALDFQFNDGAGTGDANNTVTLNAFRLGGGASSGAASVSGGASGSLASSIHLTDTSFFNEFFQTFTPGSTLNFRLSLTTNLDSGGVPDEFSLAILDSSGVEIPTLGTGNALLIIDIYSLSPSVSTFATDTSVSPAAGGPPIDIAAPTVTAVTSATPEPSSLFLCVSGAAIFAAMIAWRKRRRTS